MKTYFRNNLKQALLVLEDEGELLEGYQLEMLSGNQISGILQTSYRHVDGLTQYQYDISGMQSLYMMHEKADLSLKDIRCLTEAVLQAVKELQRYMLPATGLLLDPGYIFCDNNGYYFCYYPPEKETLKEKFHKLTEFLVQEVDYRDEEGVRLAYMLHKSTMDEHCTLEEILREFDKDKVVDYAEQMENRELEGILVEEKLEMWEPIRKFLERRKKPCK